MDQTTTTITITTTTTTTTITTTTTMEEKVDNYCRNWKLKYILKKITGKWKFNYFFK